MKKIISAIALLLLSIGAFSQTQMKPLVITEVVQCEGKTAQELYSLVKQWMLNFYDAPDKAIQLDDPSNNYIGCTAATDFQFMSGLSGTIRYNLTIETRDGRLRFQLKNIIHKSSNGDTGAWCNLGTILDAENPYDKGTNKGQKNKANAKAVSMFKDMAKTISVSMKDYIANSGSDTNDDW